VVHLARFILDSTGMVFFFFMSLHYLLFDYHLEFNASVPLYATKPVHKSIDTWDKLLNIPADVFISWHMRLCSILSS
jgi:hypothetical protein